MIQQLQSQQNTLINDDHSGGSFEDEDNDEHSHPVDRPDSQINTGKIIKAFALYDFNGHGSNGCQYVNAATIFVGECVDILEDDQGDGWTRIQKLDGTTGFVPSSYLRIDSQKLSTSQQIDSGRF